MQPVITDRSAPIFREVASVNFDGQTAQFERNGKRFEVQGLSQPIWDNLFSKMDGTRTLESLHKHAQMPKESLLKMVQAFADVELVTLPGDRKVLSGDEFWRMHNDYSRGWMDKLAGHEIWPALTEGRAPRSVAIGFVIEKFHYIEGAYEHMALAAANADPRIGQDLTRHFMEEYNHGDIYLGGLSSLFPKRAVVESLPLPSTRALLNCLNELATRNSFAYYSANEFLQKTENVGDDLGDPVEQFYGELERNYSLPSAVCRAMRAHTEQDQELGHQDVFAEMCAKMGQISEADANCYLSATRQIAEHLEFFLDGILTYYSRNPVVPRPKACVASI